MRFHKIIQQSQGYEKENIGSKEAYIFSICGKVNNMIISLCRHETQRKII